jgi:hypothetical protein
MQNMKVLPEVLVKEIKEIYSTPTASSLDALVTKTNYCVGGAFLKYIGADLTAHGFPVAGLLADYLCFYVSDHSADGAKTTCKDHYVLASSITALNDSGNFYEAWDKLEEALRTPCRGGKWRC